MPNYDRATIKRMIDMVNEENNKELTPWETSFMESITDQFDRGRPLTGPQLDALERIYTEKTP